MGKLRFIAIASDRFEEMDGDNTECLRNDIQQVCEDYGLENVKVTAEDSECIRRNDSKKGIMTDAGKIEETIEFLTNPCDNGYDEKELLNEYIYEVLKENGIEDMWSISPDLIDVSDPDKHTIPLDEFSDKLYHKIIEGVCNVLGTA